MVTLPIMPGGVPNTETYIKMMDYIVHTMVTCRANKEINDKRECFRPSFWADTHINRRMNESLITLDNLSIGYNGQPVLSGTSLSIARDKLHCYPRR